MKIYCACGEVIYDVMDDLPSKAHLIPDEQWLAVHDAIDDEVIDQLCKGAVGREAAYMLAREIICRDSRLMWQCGTCGRLYIDDPDRELRCFVPESEPVPVLCKSRPKG
jgi:hypothetical protein